MERYTHEERQLLEEKYAHIPCAAFEADRKRLAAGEPVAYVIGTQPFLGLSIHLNSRPLIPRPETEGWVEDVLYDRFMVSVGQGAPTRMRITSAPSETSSRPPRVLDLCAGSGAIGCAILKYVPDAEVWFAEIDPAHETTIQKNIRENGLDASRAHIVIGDLFESLDERFDVILTNPPYIPEGRTLPESVTAYEPSTALFAGTDGLGIIARIAASAAEHLRPSGELWLECDSVHAEEVGRLVALGGASHVDIRNDLYGRPRVVVGYYA